MRFHELLPPAERPEFTEGYDGFFYLERVNGDCESARADYIIRDHDQAKVERRKQLMVDAAAYVNKQIGSEVLSVEIHDQYHNLADIVLKPEVCALNRERTHCIREGRRRDDLHSNAWWHRRIPAFL